jgi:prefoldin subunit 5
MSEGSGQLGGEMYAGRGLDAAAGEFRRKVEEATGRLNDAAEQFVAISDGLMTAVEEARQAAARAAEAQRSIEEMKERMSRDYGNVSDLVRDLQQRISALATLAQPLPSVEPPQEPQPPEHQPANAGYGSPGESSW